MPAAPTCRYRPAHRAAVVGETWNRSAARRSGHPSSTTQRANLNRPVSDSGALRCDTRTSQARRRCVIHTEPRGPHPFKII